MNVYISTTGLPHHIFRYVFIVLSLWVTQSAHAYEVCIKTKVNCTAPAETRSIPTGGQPPFIDVHQDCWNWETTYGCIDAETSTCDNIELKGWNLESTSDVAFYNDDPSNPRISWNMNYSQNERWEYTCGDPLVDKFCAGDADCDLSSLGCENTVPTNWSDVDPTLRDPNQPTGAFILRDHWGEQSEWTCNSGATQSTLCEADTPVCVYSGFECLLDDPNVVPDPEYGTCVQWKDLYDCGAGLTTPPIITQIDVTVEYISSNANPPTPACTNDWVTVTNITPVGTTFGPTTVPNLVDRRGCSTSGMMLNILHTAGVEAISISTADLDRADVTLRAWYNNWSWSGTLNGPETFILEAVEVCPNGWKVDPTQTTCIPNVDSPLTGCFDSTATECNSDPNCSLVGFNCVEYADPPTNSICLRSEEVYDCTGTEETCGNNAGAMHCSTVNPADTNVVAYNTEDNFDQAMEGMALVDNIQREMEQMDPNDLRLFSGDREECTYWSSDAKTLIQLGTLSFAVGSISAGSVAGSGLAAALADIVFSYKFTCCTDNPTDPNGVEKGLEISDCDQGDMTLAAARMAGRATLATNRLPSLQTTYGSYWTKRDCILKNLTGGCIARITWQYGQRWCMFDSMLSRIIHEQGREQLAELAASTTAGTQPFDINFSYWNGAGGWSAPVTVNGNQIRYWQWNTACQSGVNINNATNPPTATSIMSESIRDPSIVCPIQDTVWMALCSSQSGSCGALPSDPRIGAGSSEWTVQPLGPEDNRVNAVSRYVAATGTCSRAQAPANQPPNAPPQPFAQCNYHFDAWPAGAGGQLHKQLDLEWPMYFMGGGWNQNILRLGSYEFQTFSYDMNGTRNKPDVDMRYRAVGDATWEVETLPLDIAATGFTLPNVPSSITIFGHCDEQKNTCSYRAKIAASATMKPWVGNPDNGKGNGVDCSGFTLDQVQLLDFDRMDLSEFAAQYSTPDTPEQADLVAAATDNISNYFGNYDNNTPQVTSSAAEKVVQIQPTNGFGPFDVKLYAAREWKINEGTRQRFLPVTNVIIDWGDNSPTSSPALVNENTTPNVGGNNKWVARHTYRKVSAETTYTITVSFETAEGVFTSTASVLNWRTPPENDATGSGGSAGGTSSFGLRDMPGGADNTAAPQIAPDRP